MRVLARGLAALSLSIALLAGCAPQPAPLGSPAQVEAADMTSAAPASRLSPDALRNAEYHSPDWGDFQLSEGIYYRPPLNPGESSSAYTTQMRDPIIYGDLDGDGLEDAAVILSTQNGGTGHFTELAAVLDRSGRPQNVATVSLGDRQGPETGQIQDGTIVLNMRVHGPNDPLCCPSQFETWRFRLQGTQLIRLP